MFAAEATPPDAPWLTILNYGTLGLFSLWAAWFIVRQHDAHHAERKNLIETHKGEIAKAEKDFIEALDKVSSKYAEDFGRTRREYLVSIRQQNRAWRDTIDSFAAKMESYLSTLKGGES